MKCYFAFFLGIFLMISCQEKKPDIVIIPDNQKNHLQRNHMLGKVKSVKTITLKVQQTDSTTVIEDTLSITIQHYSLDGYLTKSVKLNKKSDTISIRNFYFHPDAREKRWEELDSNYSVGFHGEYEYDINQFKSGEKIFKNDSLFFNIQYKTDGMGNIIEMTQQYDNYAIVNKMQYDKNGLVARIDEYEPNGTLFKYAIIEYDNYGDEVNRKAYKTGDQLIEYTYTQYDQNGALLKVIYEDRLHRNKEVYEYYHHDKEGNWQQEIRKKDEKIMYQRNRELIYY
ncbi:MAG: hypothetical protein RR034_03565 [Bacteroidales bacterium]